jgi:hypothetical protein
MILSRHGEVDRYFAGRLDARAEGRMRAHLPSCDVCRARYDRHLAIESALSGGAPVASERLWRGVQRASGRSVAEPAAPTRRSTTRLGLGAVAVGAAALALFVVARPRGGAPTIQGAHEPVARGREAPAAALHVFRSTSAHTTERIAAGATLHASDGLLFAYTSADPTFTHLMVFAVDAGYDVHWYYPAFLRQGDDPKAIPIVAGGAGVELGEEIRHELPPGPLRLVALFLREPRGVLEIEALVRATLAAPRRPLDADARLPVPGAAETSMMLRVTP